VGGTRRPEGRFRQWKNHKENPEEPSFVAITQPGVKDGWRQRSYWEKQLGWKEYLLCHDCEQRFGVHESKVRTFLYGSAPSPLKKRTLGRLGPPMPAGSPPEFVEFRDVKIDYRELKLFQMSLLWRAGVAEGKCFHNVDLGQKHENRLRQFLLNDDPGLEEDFPCVIFDLRFKGVESEGFCQEPITSHDEDQGQKLYKIIIGGYAFMYSVSSHRASQVFHTCSAKQSGRMLLHVVRGDLFLQRCAERLRKAGKL
jgi:hypothetical protein